MSAAACLAAAALSAGTFGRVVPIGGHAADIALDERRQVLYIANFTANRVEVMSTADLSIQRSINTAPQPGSIALSRDGRFLVVGHFSNFQPPATPNHVLTILNLETNTRQTLTFSAAVLGVAFGVDGRALIVTATEFVVLDPAAGTTVRVGTLAEVAKTLPVAPGQFPPNILAASVTATGDGRLIFGLTDLFQFVYVVDQGAIVATRYIATPTLGPRLVTPNEDGSIVAFGWAVGHFLGGSSVYQFANVSGALNLGTHAIDSPAGIMYAQVPESGPPPPLPAQG
ncbi:MAG: YncE family protein, partial [Bryobacteraceae bacterium]